MLGSLGGAAPAYADTPVVTTVNVSPSFISNALSTLISWTSVGSSGTDLYFPCTDGVSVKSADGYDISCGTRHAAGAGTSGQMAFTVTNVSGVTQFIPVTVYPKDLNGADYDSGAKTVVASVGTATQPITDFSLSSSTVASGSTVTLTWKGQYAVGANMSYSCNDNISVYEQGSNTRLVCNAPLVTPGGTVLEPPVSGS